MFMIIIKSYFMVVIISYTSQAGHRLKMCWFMKFAFRMHLLCFSTFSVLLEWWQIVIQTKSDKQTISQFLKCSDTILVGIVQYILLYFVLEIEFIVVCCGFCWPIDFTWGCAYPRWSFLRWWPISGSVSCTYIMAVLWMRHCFHGCRGCAMAISWLCHGCVMAVLLLSHGCVVAVSWLCLGYLMGVSWLCCDCCIWSIYAWLSSRWEQRSTDGVWAPQADRSCNKRSDSAPRGVLSLLPRCGEGEHRRLEVHVWGRRSSNKRCSHWLMMCLWYCWLFVILLAVRLSGDKQMSIRMNTLFFFKGSHCGHIWPSVGPLQPLSFRAVIKHSVLNIFY